MDKTTGRAVEYSAVQKRAKKAVASTIKEASEKLMEANKSLKKISKVAIRKQTVKDGKVVLGNGCVGDEIGTMCVGERTEL